MTFTNITHLYALVVVLIIGIKAEQQAFLDYYFHIDFSFLSSLDAYDGLSPREKVYLVLLHEGMEEEQVKNMMGLSDSSIRVFKSRIKSKMQSL